MTQQNKNQERERWIGLENPYGERMTENLQIAQKPVATHTFLNSSKYHDRNMTLLLL